MGNIKLSDYSWDKVKKKNSNPQGQIKLKMQRWPNREYNRTNIAYSDTRKEAVIHDLPLKGTRQIKKKKKQGR